MTVDKVIFKNYSLTFLETFIIGLWQRFDFGSQSFLSPVYAWKKLQLTELQDLNYIWIIADQKLENFYLLNFAEFHTTAYREYWRIRVIFSIGIPPFDNDIGFILAHEHLSQQLLHSSHMSNIETTIRKLIIADMYWILLTLVTHSLD